MSDIIIIAPTGPQGPAGPPGGGSGSGDVVGPSSVEDNSVAVFDGVTGKLLKVSGAKLVNGSLEVSALVLVGPGGIKWRLTLGANFGNGGINQLWDQIA